MKTNSLIIRSFKISARFQIRFRMICIITRYTTLCVYTGYVSTALARQLSDRNANSSARGVGSLITASVYMTSTHVAKLDAPKILIRC